MPLPKLTGIGQGQLGMTQVLTGVLKPFHSERVRRLKLPAISSPIKFDNTVDDTQQEFIAQLNAHNTPAGKVKLNPLRVLVPYQKKLSTLEAQRVIGVFDELKLKCELILALPIILKELPKHADLLGPELTSLLATHSVILEEFHDIEKLYLEAGSLVKTADTTGSSTNLRGETELKVREHSDISAASVRSRDAALAFLSKNLPSTMSNKKILAPGNAAGQLSHRTRSRSASDSYNSFVTTLSGCTEAQQDLLLYKLNHAKARIEFSIRNILRAFREDENIIHKLLLAAGGRRYKEATYFLQCLGELRDMLLDRLLVTPLEQNDKMQYLAQIAAQERNNQMVIQKLEADLALGLEGRNVEIMKRNDMIRDLQKNLEMLEKATEDDIRRAKTESEKQTFSENRMSTLRKLKLESELKNLSTELSGNIEDNRDNEQRLRRKKFKIESEIENWIQKFDEEMTMKQEEYEKIDAVYQEEKKQLAELEGRFKIIDEEYKEIMQKRQAEKEAREEQDRIMERKEQAVIVIQALYRAFRVKQMLKAKEKQKGKKKKKKKKGKKAKK